MCVGLPGQVMEFVDAEHGLVNVRVGAQVRQVSVAILTGGGEEIEEGDWLEIHSGHALAKLEDDEAEEMLAHIRRLDEAHRTGRGDAAPAPEREPEEGSGSGGG